MTKTIAKTKKTPRKVPAATSKEARPYAHCGQQKRKSSVHSYPACKVLHPRGSLRVGRRHMRISRRSIVQSEGRHVRAMMTALHMQGTGLLAVGLSRPCRREVHVPQGLGLFSIPLSHLVSHPQSPVCARSSCRSRSRSRSRSSSSSSSRSSSRRRRRRRRRRIVVVPVGLYQHVV